MQCRRRLCSNHKLRVRTCDSNPVHESNSMPCVPEAIRPPSPSCAIRLSIESAPPPPPAISADHKARSHHNASLIGQQALFERSLPRVSNVGGETVSVRRVFRAKLSFAGHHNVGCAHLNPNRRWIRRLLHSFAQHTMSTRRAMRRISSQWSGVLMQLTVRRQVSRRHPLHPTASPILPRSVNPKGHKRFLTHGREMHDPSAHDCWSSVKGSLPPRQQEKMCCHRGSKKAAATCNDDLLPSNRRHIEPLTHENEICFDCGNSTQDNCEKEPHLTSCTGRST